MNWFSFKTSSINADKTIWSWKKICKHLQNRKDNFRIKKCQIYGPKILIIRQILYLTQIVSLLSTRNSILQTTPFCNRGSNSLKLKYKIWNGNCNKMLIKHQYVINNTLIGLWYKTSKTIKRIRKLWHN